MTETKTSPREWLVIESSMSRAVFAPKDVAERKGYIPRDVVEAMLGRSVDDCHWFTREQSAAMRAHAEWRDHEEDIPGKSAGQEIDYVI